MTQTHKDEKLEKQQTEKQTDKEIADSFPASDPPSWTGGKATGVEEPK